MMSVPSARPYLGLLLLTIRKICSRGVEKPSGIIREPLNPHGLCAQGGQETTDNQPEATDLSAN